MEEKAKGKYEEEDELSDIVLVVDGKKLHVSKTLLMFHSPVFKKMFTTEFKEKDLKEIPLPGKKHNLMVRFLDQIYPGNHTSLLIESELMNLLQLADEYDVQQVFDNCQTFICKSFYEDNYLGVNSIMLFLWIMEKWGGRCNELRRIRSGLVKRAATHSIQKIRRSGVLHCLSVEVQRDIFEQRLDVLE